MPRVVGPPHGRRPAQYDLCPGWTPDPGHCGGSAPRSQPSRQPQSRPRARPSGALQVWTRVGEGPQRRRTPNTISAPDGSTDPGQWRYRPSVAAASPAARPARGASSWGTAGRAGRRRSTAGASAQYDLCPRWPDRPGALRVSCVEAASPVLLNTISAPDGPTTPGHCGYRRVTAIFYDPRPGGYPQGNRPMRGTGRISSGAPRVQDPGHPPSRPGAVTVALSDRLQPSRRS